MTEEKYVGRFNRDVMFSSKDLEWRTPKGLYDYLDARFHFTLDPCTSEDNPMGAPKFYTEKEDGLAQSWAEEIVYINPPYGREYPKWVKKAYEEVYEGDCFMVVLLLPARTDTKVFHEYCVHGEIWFLKGRLKFGDSKNSAPFPSMVVIFKKVMSTAHVMKFNRYGEDIYMSDHPDPCPKCGKKTIIIVKRWGGSLGPIRVCTNCDWNQYRVN